MGQVKMQAHVEAPIDQVFDYAADVNRWAEWNVSVVEMTPGAPLAAIGDRFAGKNKFMGRVEDIEGRVTSLDRPRLMAFVSGPPTGGHENWTAHFTVAGSGTDIDCVIDYEVPLGLVGALADKLFVERQVQRMLDQSRDNFIALVEHEVLQPV
jgi:uncharacterized membrane protein